MSSFIDPSQYSLSPWRSRPIVEPSRAATMTPPVEMPPPRDDMGYYNIQMGPSYDPNDLAQPFMPQDSYEMPEFGSEAYQKQMGHIAPAGPDSSKQLPKFDPYSGADWLRGVGLFAKGAIFGPPKEVGPADNTSKSGKNVSKESTFDQKDYWGWLFNS